MKRDPRWPNVQELGAEAREAGNIVIGALIGAYLGLAMTANQSQKSYWSLGHLIIDLALYAMAINAFGDRASRFNWPMALWYALWSWGWAICRINRP